MNNGFYKDLDTNFEQAFEMANSEQSREELFEMLKNGNIPQKQIAAMKLDEVRNPEEAEILINNLTGCDGKIREAVALKIYELLKINPDNIKIFETYSLKLANATIDINGNICRIVIDIVKILKQSKDFSKKYLNYLLKFIEESFKGLDEIKFRDKKYTVNKQLFKLYWCLESLRLFSGDLNSEKLLPILEGASREKEYTIREKTAQILITLNDGIYDSLKNKLKADDNYYVRNILKTVL